MIFQISLPKINGIKISVPVIIIDKHTYTFEHNKNLKKWN